MQKDITVYKIIRNSDGLFANGKTTVAFTKKGKVWTSLSAVKLHLGKMATNSTWSYIDCSVVSYTANQDTMTYLDIMEQYKQLAVLYRLSGNI